MKQITKLGIPKVKGLGLNSFPINNKFNNSYTSSYAGELKDFIIDAYWTNKYGQKITRAKFGDIVKFNLLVSNDVPENSVFLVQPYEENKIRDKSLGEALDITVKSSGKNKFGSVDFFINYDWDYLLDEMGENNDLELYFRVSNWGETIKMPLNGKG